MTCKMSSHTPGPWDVQNKGQPGTNSARHEVVAGINTNGEKYLPTIVKMPDLSERSYANARLIASAPALLAALQATLRVLVTPSGVPDVGKGRTDAQQDALDQAQQALARAEGR